ncbi:MAG: CRISPR-associated helicase Cas3' [Chitinispirillaceae bacterium]|nr:CRISPR-associated helicase Cas3' [Chitinispirillaceae bacterium]
MLYRARKNQTLAEHLTNTANLSKMFAGVFGCEKIAHAIGLLHDLGKYSMAFQDYLNRSLKGEKVIRGEIIHALQGAKFAAENISDAVVADIVGNVIATHHSGLFDTITDGERTLTIKTNKGEEFLHYNEVLKACAPQIDTTDIKDEILGVCNISHAKKLNPFFVLHLMTKAIYSCLVDADRCDAAGITPEQMSPDWDMLTQQLYVYLGKIVPKNGIDNIRMRISEQCQQAGKQRQQGIYALSVPTGGGKTLSSLRFAFEHAKKHNLKRIIYVIPYLSILDQTAAKLREVFIGDDDLILEHHSNIEVPGDNEDDEEQHRLLTSRWDSPIILTTMVQFLETVYSNKASKLRKFHNMSEAVLIFDEIQALPIKCIHLFNEAVNFLQVFGKSTILLCTATQPHLHKTVRPVLLSERPDIINLSPEELNVFKRVYIKDATQQAMDHEQIAALVKTQIEQGKSTLIILNTKNDARKVFELCKPFECGKAFLTTDLCPAHRLNILEQLRRNLARESRLLTLCVSTQLIEAGVDVSFDCVIRAEAGMDSIIQAAGRCNRNKENQEPQTVFVINVKDEKLSRLPEINDGKKITARVFRENSGKDLSGNDVMDIFYRYYFYEQNNKMDYTVKAEQTTIYSLLGENPIAKVAYRNLNNRDYPGMPCSFKTAADAFSVIDGGQTGIVVPYADALKLVAEFQECRNPKEKMRILKQLQKYTVSVYSNTLAKIGQAASVIDDTFYLLNPDYYDEKEQGLLLESKCSFLYV